MLTGVLYQVRAVVPEHPNHPISDTGMPLEWEYSDDVDFIEVEPEPLQELLPKCFNLLQIFYYCNDCSTTINLAEFQLLRWLKLARSSDMDCSPLSL